MPSIFERIHPDDAAHIKQTYRDFLDGKLKYIKTEFRVVTDKNGQSRTDWLEVHAAVVESDDRGRAKALIGSLLLITERKKQEQTLVRPKRRPESQTA